MRILLIFIIIMALMPTACATVTDFTVIEPFPETAVAGNHVNATVSFITYDDAFNITITVISPTLFENGYPELVSIYLLLDGNPMDNYISADNCYTNVTQDTIISTVYIPPKTFPSCKHILTVGFWLNPAIQPDDYTFDLTVSWQEYIIETATTKTETARTHSGSHQVIEKEDPFRHFIDNWSPYEDDRNGEIHLNGEEDEYEYGNITDEDDEQVEQEPFNLGWLMILLIFVVIWIILIYDFKKSKDKYENKQKHA